MARPANTKLTAPLAAHWPAVTGPLEPPPTLAARDAEGGETDAAGNPTAAHDDRAAGDRRGSGSGSVRGPDRLCAQRERAHGEDLVSPDVLSDKGKPRFGASPAQINDATASRR